MKKLSLSLIIAFALLFSLSPSAYAEEYITMGSCTAGSALNSYISEIAPGCTASAEYLPTGCQLVSEPGDAGEKLYLRGTPLLAGLEQFQISVTGASSYNILCTLEINPAVPTVTGSENVNCKPGDIVTLSVSAQAADGGNLSYQWFYDNGQLVPGATGSAFSPSSTLPGVSRYYCEVTNTNNGRIAAVDTGLFTVTVTEPKVQSIAVATLPTKLEYVKGEALNSAGLSIRVSYADGSSAILTGGFTVTPASFTTNGTQTVLVSYQAQQCSFQVSVGSGEEVVEGIGLVTLPDKTLYHVGDKLETSGLSIRVYTASSHYDVSSGLDCQPQTLSAEGSQTITVTFGGKTCTFKVTVEAVKETVQTIAVVQKPAKLEYTVGDRLDSTGLSVKVTTNKGTETISTGFSCTPKVLTTAGTQEIKVIYGALSTSFTVTVKEKTQASPSPSPTKAPLVSASPTAAAVTATPQHTPNNHESHETGAGNALVKVIVIVALLALAGLAAYVYIMQRKGQR